MNCSSRIRQLDNILYAYTEMPVEWYEKENPDEQILHRFISIVDVAGLFGTRLGAWDIEKQATMHDKE